jgi:AcrR family transcriptional regulator
MMSARLEGYGMVRVDASRNRSAILGAARTLVAAHGSDVGMDEIARQAGVAVGTLYRHFPTKGHLVGAVMDALAEGILADLDAALARIDAGGSAIDEIAALFYRVAVDNARDRALRDAAANLGTASVIRIKRHAVAALGRMVTAAHSQGALRPDITASDVVLLMGTLPGERTPERARRRWVELTLRGLRH